MKCSCGEETQVIDSRETQSGVRRRRSCKNCNLRFTTLEIHSDHNIFIEIQKKLLKFQGEVVHLARISGFMDDQLKTIEQYRNAE